MTTTHIYRDCETLCSNSFIDNSYAVFLGARNKGGTYVVLSYLERLKNLES